MYLQKVVIDNIRSISHFEMAFPAPAGWHVLIGDNGSGKSSIVRAIAFALIGSDEATASRTFLPDWLKRDSTFGNILLNIYRDKKYDGEEDTKIDLENLTSSVKLRKGISEVDTDSGEEKELTNSVLVEFYIGDRQAHKYKLWGNHGWFSAGFGPFRRFSGGNQETEKLYKSYPRLGAHLSIFGEDVALSEALEWVKELDYLRLKENEKKNGQESTITYNSLIKFINESNLLPHNVQIEGIDKEGIVFKDGNGNSIQALELSDGYAFRARQN